MARQCAICAKASAADSGQPLHIRTRENGRNCNALRPIWTVYQADQGLHVVFKSGKVKWAI